MNRLVLAEDVGSSVVAVILNRPERHNSLVPELLQEFLEVLRAQRARDTLRAVVLLANGRSFSTGGDVGVLHGQPANELERYASRLVQLLNDAILLLIGFPVPVVAAVHGTVTGGAIGLVLASDIVLVTPETTFAPYYPVVGFSPDGGWTALLPGVIGPKRAADVLLCNRTITAEQAVAWGIASRILSHDRLREEAYRVALDIASMRPGSIRHTKSLLRGTYADLGARLALEHRHFCEQIRTEEARQGMRDFLRSLRTLRGSG